MQKVIDEVRLLPLSESGINFVWWAPPMVALRHFTLKHP